MTTELLLIGTSTSVIETWAKEAGIMHDNGDPKQGAKIEYLPRPLMIKSGAAPVFDPDNDVYANVLLTDKIFKTDQVPRPGEGPILYDLMDFVGKPNLGLSTDVHLIHEWEATLEHDPEVPPSAETIELPEYTDLIAEHAHYPFLGIDIESLDHPEQDYIAMDYVTLAQGAAPDSAVTWWNLGPTNIVDTPGNPFDYGEWAAEFDARKPLVDVCDFCLMAFYFRSTDTYEIWYDRHIPRVEEARRLFGDKPVICTLSPHPFDLGKPWQHVGGKLMTQAMDAIWRTGAEGNMFWSFEGTGQLQTWDPAWPWIPAITERYAVDGDGFDRSKVRRWMESTGLSQARASKHPDYPGSKDYWTKTYPASERIDLIWPLPEFRNRVWAK